MRNSKFDKFSIYCLISIFVCIFFTIPTSAQQFDNFGNLQYTKIFSTTGTDVIINVSGRALIKYQLAWDSASSPLASCTIELDKSDDGINWSILVPAQSCINAGNSGVNTGSARNVRLNLTALSGGNVTIKLSGYTQLNLGNSGLSANVKLVQAPANNFSIFTTVTTFTFTYGANTQPGTLLVCTVGVAVADSGHTHALTDTQANIWLQAGTSDIGISQIFWANSKGGANTVTDTLNLASTGRINCSEYSGIYGAHPVEGATSNLGSTFNPIGNIPTPINGSLSVTIYSTNGVSTNWSNAVGCTLRTNAAAVSIYADNLSSSNNFSICNINQAALDFIGKTVSFYPATYNDSNSIIVKQDEGAASSPNGGAILLAAASPNIIVLPGGCMTGHTIILFTQQLVTSVDNITGVNDSAGYIFTRLAGSGQIADCCNHRFYATYTAPCVIGSNTNDTITVTMSAGTEQIAAVEVSSINLLDTSTLNAGSITATFPNEFLLSSFGVSGAGTNFSNLSGSDIYSFNKPSINVNMVVTYKLSSSGSNSITGTSSAGAIGNYTILLKQGFLTR